MQKHLVVVGGGQAAAQAIHTARQLGFAERITLVADEPELPYQRPPLSKQYLAGKLPRERLALRPASFYESREVELRLGARAAGLDTAKRRVTLDDGDVLEYSSLLLTTGSRARVLDAPGIGLDGIHYLRSVADVDAIAPALEPGRRLVIIGGGYIGLEVAAVAAGSGLDVTVLEAASRVLGRVVDPMLSAYYTARHRDAGVSILTDAAVSRFIGSDRIEAVETADGQRFGADVVIIGIGIVPNVELALTAGLDAANGILVNADGQTPVAGIAAAGDCTRQVHPFVGAEIRLESVHNAVSQGKAVGHRLVGASAPFTEVPWFWSDQYDMKLQIAGVSIDYDDTVLRGDPDGGAFSLYYLRNRVPIAVDCVNSPREFMQGKRLLAARALVPADVLADADADLGTYLD